MPPLYHLANIQKSYNNRLILDIADLAIERGEVLALVGPSGAGKSTLLRLLNFLETPTTGSITFDGQPVPPNPPIDLIRRITTVFQRPMLLSRPVGQNVAYGLQLRGLNHGASVAGALKRVGLEGMETVEAPTLSGGEMQRVALARALVINPDVLLLDEPTANLDPYNVGLIESIITEQNRSYQTSIIIVTHNIFQARRLATRVGLLLGGKLVELAPVTEFFTNPRDPRTAAFVNGEMAY